MDRIKLMQLKILKSKSVILSAVFILIVIAIMFNFAKNPDVSKYKIKYVPYGGDFSIKTHRGEFSTEHFRGKVIYLFFGFSHCPSVCPLTISQINNFLKRWAGNLNEKPVAVFISVDYIRDHQNLLKEKYEKLDSNFYVGSGSAEQVLQIMKKFGAMYSLQNENNNVFIEHSDDIYVINQKGEWFDTLPFDADMSRLAAAQYNSKTALTKIDLKNASEEYEVVGTNESCDLGFQDCEVEMANGEKIKLSLSPKPIQLLQRLKLILNYEASSYREFQVEVRGIERDMGFNRSKLEKKIFALNEYEGEVYLPICELKQMSWSVEILMKDMKNYNKLAQFRLSTKRN